MLTDSILIDWSQGEKALKRFSMFSSTSKFEDACEFFQKAANSYKVAKKCESPAAVTSLLTLISNRARSGGFLCKVR
jgi:hypothetical protein